ncbi:MAG: hypothetical protein QMC79_07800 [Anaerosomatales bacterium]|nr:hypothetical protein [Anaerosomatales bacterium]
MAGLLIMFALLAGAGAYAVGYAFVAPRDSFLRSVPGGMVLAACVLVALVGPPSMLGVARSASGALGDGIDPALYRALWLGLATLGLLAGMRVWRMRPGGRGGRLFALDESPSGRAAAELPLADSLEAALDVLSRERVTMRDVPRLAETIRHAGARFFHQMPERQSELYALVTRHAPTEVAAEVTGLLLEGAGRR